MTYKWNLGWMHDTLDYLATPFTERAGMKTRFLFSMSYFYQENYILPPLPTTRWCTAKRRSSTSSGAAMSKSLPSCAACTAICSFIRAKSSRLWGNELAEFMEWSEERQPGWNLLDYPVHRSFHVFLQRLNTLYCTCPALWGAGF